MTLHQSPHGPESSEPSYKSFSLEDGFPVMQDPVVEDAYSLLLEYQHELDYTPSPSENRLHEIVYDLDENWPYFGMPVWISGIIKSAIIEQSEMDSDHCTQDTVAESSTQPRIRPIMSADGTDAVTREYTVNDTQFQSHGFTVDFENWPETVGGMDIGKRAVLKLLFTREVNVALDDGTQERCRLTTTSSFNKVAIELPYMSDELAERLCQENFSQLMTEVETRLSDASSLSERVRALRGLEIPRNEFLTEQHVEALEQELNNLIGLAYEDMPFYFQCYDGSPVFVDEMTRNALKGDENHLVTIQRLIIAMPHESGGDETNTERSKLAAETGEIRLTFTIIGQDTYDDVPELSIRLADVVDLWNVRDSR